MKKSLLILSVLALAGNVSAYDELVPGTAEAPNYYLIQANRGIVYLGYSAEGVELTFTQKVEGQEEPEVIGTYTTNLYRTNDWTTANVWAVYEGEEEGTVVIKSAVADAYMLGFFDKDGNASETMGAVANTVDVPTDIYAISMGETGCYSLALRDTNGYTTEGEEGSQTTYYYTLDATGGSSNVCGNWVPNDAGTKWWMTKIDVAAGQTVDEALCQMHVEAGHATLSKFIAAVPQVASTLEVGQSTLDEVTADEDYVTKITELLESAYAAANAEMMNCFAGKNWALKNVRRMDTGAADGPYVATSTLNRKYVPSASYADPMTSFTFKSNGAGGYTLYNEATQTYIGVVVEQVEDQNTHEMKDVDKVSPVSDESKATVFYPCLKGVGDYYGIALSRNADYSGQGINFQSWVNGSVDYYSVNDAGSVWQLIEVTPEGMVADVVASVENALSPYIPNIYVIKDIFEKAISDAKALTYSADLLTKANEIKAQAFEDANELLATGLGDKGFALKYLRGNDYVAVGEVDGTLNYVHVQNGLEPNAQFTFKALEEGGYYVYNAATETYFGPQQAEEFDDKGNLKDTLTIVDDEEYAQELFPVLYNIGDYYGVALPFVDGAETTTPAINMNGYDGLHAYMIGDAGSIWGLFDPAETSIEEVGEAAVAPVKSGIYDLSGRRLAAPVKGINIINGKKVLVK